MTIRLRFNNAGKDYETTFVGVATVSENPPQLNLLVTDPVWNDLTETLSGAMILALTLEHSDGKGENASILYLKDGEGDRERTYSYLFNEGYDSSNMGRVEAQVNTTLVKSDQVRKAMPIKWKWEGSRHSD